MKADSIYIETEMSLDQEDLILLDELYDKFSESVVVTEAVAGFMGKNKGFKISINQIKIDMRDLLDKVLRRLLTKYEITVFVRNQYGEIEKTIKATTTNLEVTLQKINSVIWEE